MKIEHVEKKEPSFKPVQFIWTCETQDDMNKLASVLNYTPIVEFLGIGDENPVEKQGSDMYLYWEEFKTLIEDSVK